MKRRLWTITFILIALSFTGCMGKTKLTESPGEGYIVFTLQKGGPTAQTEGLLPEPTHIRVGITHDNGFKLIETIEISDSEQQDVAIPVPSNNGYRVDAVSYIEDWQKYAHETYSLLLKSDTQDGINVAPEQITEVHLELRPIRPTITLPEEVTATEPFEMTVSNVPDTLASYAMVVVQPTPFSENPHLFQPLQELIHSTKEGFEQTFSGVINAPNTQDAGYMYVNAFFTLSAQLAKDQTEYYWLFTHWTPNVDLGEPEIKVPLKLPDGGIGVTIVY